MMSETMQLSGIQNAPYDVLLQIISLLSAPDIVQLLSTCRTLYSLVREERIWRSLSVPFGVTDVDHFGGRPFYAVYSGLLHKYGPLIGLWAGDHAFSGHILEFRLDGGGQDREASIVGEFWRFRKPHVFQLAINQPPEQPYYVPVIRIAFPTSTDDTSDMDVAQAVCTATAPPGIEPDTHPLHFKCMEETKNGIFLGGDDFMALLQHPDFPQSTNATWLDGRRPPLTFPVVQTPSPTRQSHGLRTAFFGLTWQFVMNVRPGRTNVVKPRALSIACGEGCIQSASPALSMRVETTVVPRYYPLRMEIKQGIDISSEHWSPASLGGLWLGWYGPHGTECLFVDWDERRQRLSALKITGDENVPRGVPSWEVWTAEQTHLDPGERQLCTHLLADPDVCRLYRGTGTTSGTGFLPSQQRHPPIILVVMGPDLLGIVWLDGEFMLYNSRYRGRVA